MGLYTLNAETLGQMIVGGAANLRNNMAEVNELNVFPVPDGDTGFNMTKTIEGGAVKIKDKKYDSCSDLAEDFIHGALLSARGNSGVILSQIFKGIQLGTVGHDEMNIDSICNALKKGVELAYLSVDKPVEGTILTVYREAVEYAVKNIFEGITIEEFLKLHIEQAEKTLAKTIDMMPVLKEAGVIDSGGAGYVKILEGAYKALTGEEIIVEIEDNEPVQQELDFSAFTRDSVMTYGYCTELIIRLQTSKNADVDNFDINLIKDYLKDQGGDSIVTYKDGDIVKVHVHTLTPGVMLNGLQKYGEFLHIKIENMTLQHNETLVEEEKPKKSVAVVAVANGDGIIDTLKEMGVDGIVNGGQTGNPSSEDFIAVFDTINAENIIVLPNNGNIILAAEQAAKLYEKAKVTVVKTKTIQQGYCALSVFVDEEVEQICQDMMDAIENVSSFEVTYAIRDALLNGVEVKKNQYMCISDDNLLYASDSKVDAAVSGLKKFEDVENKEILTVFYGKDLTEEEKEEFRERVASEFDYLDLVDYEGGQNVYSFLISLE